MRQLRDWLDASFRNRLLGSLLLASLGATLALALLGYGAVLVFLHDRARSESELALEAAGDRAEQALALDRKSHV